MQLFIYAAALALFLSLTASNATEISITMDDFNIHEGEMITPVERNQKILDTLRKYKIKAGLFVIAQHIKTKSDRALLQQWGQEGHLIGNHTFTHSRYDSKQTFEAETEEVRQCESVLSKITGFEKLFRFPMLAEGDTTEKRDQMRKWLRENGYKVGSVTIDASDWYIDQRLREKLKIDPKFDLNNYRNYYLAHIWDRANYYNDLVKKVLDRGVKHTLLIHFNLLNVLFLDDLIAMFESHGWKMIDAKSAFQDPIFSRLPNSMPSGQSLIWALAKETGKYDSELRYPGEDDVYEKPKMDALGL